MCYFEHLKCAIHIKDKEVNIFQIDEKGLQREHRMCYISNPMTTHLIVFNIIIKLNTSMFNHGKLYDFCHFV